MGKIATEQDVYNVGKKGTPTANKCCTKERVTALGCTLTQSRNAHQLVMEGTYKKSTTDIYCNVTLSQFLLDNTVAFNFHFNPTKTLDIGSGTKTEQNISVSLLLNTSSAAYPQSFTVPKGQFFYTSKISPSIPWSQVNNVRMTSVSCNPSVTTNYSYVIGIIGTL